MVSNRQPTQPGQAIGAASLRLPRRAHLHQPHQRHLSRLQQRGIGPCWPGLSLGCRHLQHHRLAPSRQGLHPAAGLFQFRPGINRQGEQPTARFRLQGRQNGMGIGQRVRPRKAVVQAE